MLNYADRTLKWRDAILEPGSRTKVDETFVLTVEQGDKALYSIKLETGKEGILGYYPKIHLPGSNSSLDLSWEWSWMASKHLSEGQGEDGILLAEAEMAGLKDEDHVIANLIRLITEIRPEQIEKVAKRQTKNLLLGQWALTGRCWTIFWE